VSVVERPRPPPISHVDHAYKVSQGTLPSLVLPCQPPQRIG
jgi:hypothetical protein